MFLVQVTHFIHVHIFSTCSYFYFHILFDFMVLNMTLNCLVTQFLYVSCTGDPIHVPHIMSALMRWPIHVYIVRLYQEIHTLG